jgi:hypothetical protein
MGFSSSLGFLAASHEAVRPWSVNDTILLPQQSTLAIMLVVLLLVYAFSVMRGGDAWQRGKGLTSEAQEKDQS